MKIIFLDIDGVLNRIGADESRTTTEEQGYIGMEPELVQRFNAVVNITGSHVVLSSTWRKFDKWQEIMAKWGVHERIIGRTPVIWEQGKVRGDEIKQWLEDNPMPKCHTPTSCPYPMRAMCQGHRVERWCIIDDDSDMLPGQVLFKTHYATGLTEEVANKVIEFMK